MKLPKILLDFILETLVKKFFGSQLLHHLDQAHGNIGGTRFIITLIGLAYGEMLIVMTVYSLIRPHFSSRIRTVFITSLFFILFSAFLTAHIVNLGTYSFQLWLVFFILTMLEIPPAVFAGSMIFKDGKK